MRNKNILSIALRKNQTFLWNERMPLFLSLNKHFSYSNLTNEEKKAIYSFRDGSSIIITEAHKGFGIIVLDRSKYLAEAKT